MTNKKANATDTDFQTHRSTSEKALNRNVLCRLNWDRDLVSSPFTDL